ncbi:MAG: SusC/RagA family TonB-linked outer membrane protein, partial [Acidobacterium ailaaui]|nr:SusC/RagA family TonB-linked outer membrane protein [Pseudacidobacterium ailaaui]
MKRNSTHCLSRRVFSVALFATLLFFSKAVFAQQSHLIRGQVFESNGRTPLPGVTVVVKGTQSGTVTDNDGRYQIEASPGDSLEFRYVGYQERHIRVDGQSQINVSLIPVASSLNELVVIGYGTEKAKDVTGAVATVSSKDFLHGNVTDLGQLIQGKVAGLTVVSPSGDPNGGTQILLRGQTTLMGANQNPLVLIDGIPGDLKNIPPQDIESISVLKDGSAAAIYGTRANNGVILITTKHASGNKSVNYDAYLSAQTIARKLNVSTAKDFRQQIAEGYRDASQDHGASTDWLKEISRIPLIQSHNLSFGGGDKESSYFINLNYKNAPGFFLKSYRQELSGNIDFKRSLFDDKVNIDLKIFSANTNWNGFNGYIYRQSIIQNPTSPVKNPDGSWYQEPTKFEYENPVSDLMESNSITNEQNSRYSANISYHPIKNLMINSLFAYSKLNQDGGYSETKKNISTIRDGRNGYASVGASMWIERMAEVTAQYEKYFDKHHLTLLAGYSYTEDYYRTHSMNNWDFPTDEFSFSDIQTGNALKDGLASESSDIELSNLVGFFSRLMYDYQDKYLLMASLRREEASQLWGTKHPWGTFPAISIGWRITQEPFLRNQTIFNDIKIRAGYGVTGSQPSQPFLGVAMLGYGLYFYSNGTWIQTLVPTQNPNPDLKWEEKHELNVGIDFSLLSNRIYGSIDYYNRKIKDLLFYFPVPSPPNLYPFTEANAGVLQNKGVEISVNIIPIKSHDFEWTSSISYSTNANKLVSLSNDLYKLSTDYLTIGYTGPPVQTFTHLLRVGGKVGDFYGFKVIGIGDDPSDPANYGQWIYEGTQADGKPGQAIKYSDFSHSFEDKTVIGNGVPKFYAGWNNTIRYKNWELSITQRGAFHFQIANMSRMMYENPTFTQYNLLKSAFNKVFGKVLLKSPQEFNSYYIENGDYWKIDNVTISYSFNNIKSKYFRSVRL